MASKLETHMAKATKSAPTADIAAALKALVMAKLRKPQPRQSTLDVVRAEREAAQRKLDALRAERDARQSAAATRSRSKARRIGRNRHYVATAKTDVSRSGTFRRYMIAAIRAHNCTRDANDTHARCSDSKWAVQKLDFNWAADNGFITWAD